MTRGDLPPEPYHTGFRTTLVRVLFVQAVAIAILGLLQAVYNVTPR